MISGIASQGIQQLYSSQSNGIGSQNRTPNQISSQDSSNQDKQQSPVTSLVSNQGQDNYPTVNATISGQEGQATRQQSEGKQAEPQDDGKKAGSKPAAEKAASPTELSEEELKVVQQLKQRDIEVRAHEAAHLAAAGQHAQGGAKFSLTRGPDGRSYAIGGSVSIDTSPEPTPEETIQKADQIKRAALAPAEPSGQDRSVAADATKMKLEAQSELAEQNRSEAKESLESEDEDVINANAGPAAENGEEGSNPGQEPSNADPLKSEAQPTCAVCGGAHPTGPHLQSNQRKTDQYIAPIQGQGPSLNQVA